MRALVLVVLVVAGLSRAEPVEVVDGNPVGYVALLEGEVVVVVKHEDGYRLVDRELGGSYAPNELTFVSDLKGEVVASVRRIKASYRGKEGWQNLRWGMTTAEVQKAMKGRTLPPKKEEMEGLAWATTVAGRPARVGCLLAKGRLVGVTVVVPGIDEEALWDLLKKKYGDTAEGLDGNAFRWRTNEGTVVGDWNMLAGTIRYTSKAFAFEALVAFQKMRDQQSKEF